MVSSTMTIWSDGSGGCRSTSQISGVSYSKHGDTHSRIRPSGTGMLLALVLSARNHFSLSQYILSRVASQIKNSFGTLLACNALIPRVLYGITIRSPASLSISCRIFLAVIVVEETDRFGLSLRKTGKVSLPSHFVSKR